MTCITTIGNESHLLMIAEYGTMQQVKKLVKTVRFAEWLCLSKVDRYFNSPNFNTPINHLAQSGRTSHEIASNPTKFIGAYCDFL